MTDYTTSSGNVFKDLDLPSPDERLVKAKLAYKINRLITDRGITQKEAADLLQMRKSKMANLRNGRLQGFTVNYLSALLEKLEHQVELTSKSITPLA